MVAVDDLRTRPGTPPIPTETAGDGEVAPPSGGLDTSEVDQDSSLLVIVQGTTGHVSVRNPEKRPWSTPLRGSGFQTGRKDNHFTAVLIRTTEPDCQQRPVRAPGDRRLMVVMIHHDALRRFPHIRDRLRKKRLAYFMPTVFFNPVQRPWPGPISRKGSGIRGTDNTKANQIRTVFRKGCATGGRAQETRIRRM